MRMLTLLTMMLLLMMLTMMLMLVLVAAVQASSSSRGISGQVQFLFTNCDPAAARSQLVNITPDQNLI